MDVGPDLAEGRVPDPERREPDQDALAAQRRQRDAGVDVGAVGLGNREAHPGAVHGGGAPDGALADIQALSTGVLLPDGLLDGRLGPRHGQRASADPHQDHLVGVGVVLVRLERGVYPARAVVRGNAAAVAVADRTDLDLQAHKPAGLQADAGLDISRG